MEKKKPCRQWYLFLGELCIKSNLIWAKNIALLIHLQFCVTSYLWNWAMGLVGKISWKHVLINYTPALGIAFDDTISGELLRLQFRGQQSSAREWGLPLKPVLCLKLLLGIIVGVLFVPTPTPPPFLFYYNFLSPPTVLFSF